MPYGAPRARRHAKVVDSFDALVSGGRPPAKKPPRVSLREAAYAAHDEANDRLITDFDPPVSEGEALMFPNATTEAELEDAYEHLGSIGDH